jgi:hypothetical protein
MLLVAAATECHQDALLLVVASSLIAVTTSNTQLQLAQDSCEAEFQSLLLASATARRTVHKQAVPEPD